MYLLLDRERTELRLQSDDGLVIEIEEGEIGDGTFLIGAGLALELELELELASGRSLLEMFTSTPDRVVEFGAATVGEETERGRGIGEGVDVPAGAEEERVYVGGASGRWSEDRSPRASSMHIIPIVILIASSTSVLRWLSLRAVGEARLAWRLFSCAGRVVVAVEELPVGMPVDVGVFPVFIRSAGGLETNSGVASIVTLAVSLSGVGGGVTYIVGGRGTGVGFVCDSGLVARLGGAGLPLFGSPFWVASSGSWSGFLAGMPFALDLVVSAACC